MASVRRRAVLRVLLGSTTLGNTTIAAGCRDDCDDPSLDEACTQTMEDEEGPFYTADAPLRTTLADPDQPGERITIEGRILDARDCLTGLSGYVLDLWHADADGRYDNAGFTLRGRISSDDEGAFIIDTILPGSYPDRPQRHIHVKVRRPDDSDLLTTQIYFSDDPNLGCHSTGPRISLVDGYGTLDFIVPA